MTDHEFEGAVIAAAERGVRIALDGEKSATLRELSHREIAQRIQTMLSAYVSPGSRYRGARTVLGATERHVDALAGLQSPTGLFVGGDNVQSPPDSAFTINDVCDVYAFTDGHEDAALEPIRERLGAIIHAATPPLTRGGVHTPNHRWELAAALTRIHRSFPDERIVERVGEWLAEGIDVDADGVYSERSPNYAAHVTNPSLLLMARVLRRDDLRDIVEHNLEATLVLIRPDGSVETVQSRRQDQTSRFGLEHYLAQFRLLANSTGRADFSWAARQAQDAGVHDQRLLAAALIEPTLLDSLPPASAPEVKRAYSLGTVGLMSRHDGAVESVVYGGSDYAVHRRVRSGLANNPTFFRLFAGDAELDAVRLSRSFFDLGPFRADSLSRLEDGGCRLDERIAAAYYRPLPESERRESGAYDLVDDGRFSAAMSFPDRERDELTMTTRIDIHQHETGADIAIGIQAPPLLWALELTFRPGGRFEGVEAIGDRAWLLTGPEGSYRVGDDRIAFGPGGASVSPGSALYHPGQEYEYLGGTDATDGEHVYIVGTAPSDLTVRVRADRVAER